MHMYKHIFFLKSPESHHINRSWPCIRRDSPNPFLLAFLQLTIYEKFMTLPCSVPSKVMFLDNQMVFPLKLHILAFPSMVSFFFFYLRWIITLHFLSKSIGNGLMEFMCSFHRYLLHVNSVEVIASPATQQLTCISWMVGNRLNWSLLSIYS